LGGNNDEDEEFKKAIELSLKEEEERVKNQKN
jgi:hypothetical protein